MNNIKTIENTQSLTSFRQLSSSMAVHFAFCSLSFCVVLFFGAVSGDKVFLLTILRWFLCRSSSLFVRRWFHLFLYYVFYCLLSICASGRLCLAFVALQFLDIFNHIFSFRN